MTPELQSDVGTESKFLFEDVDGATHELDDAGVGRIAEVRYDIRTLRLGPSAVRKRVTLWPQDFRALARLRELEAE